MTPEQRAKLCELIETHPHLSGVEIAKEVGVSETTAKVYKRELLSRKSLSVPAAPYDPQSSDKDGGALLEDWAKDSSLHLATREAAPHDVVVRNFTGSPMIVHLSDQHIGSKLTDHAGMLQDARDIAAMDGVYCVIGGDVIDNPVKHLSHMKHSRTTPSEQISAATAYLEILKDKIIGIVRGNHEDWTDDAAGVDVLQQITKNLGIKTYSPYALRIFLQSDVREIRIDLRHKYRFDSQLNRGMRAKKLFDEGEWAWDLSLSGHTHDGPIIGNFFRQEAECWYSIAGSYKVADGYGERNGFNKARAIMSGFVLGTNYSPVLAASNWRSLLGLAYGEIEN